MRDESRTWRKPQQRTNIVAVRERIARARTRMEGGATIITEYGVPRQPVDVLDVCCSALETALLMHVYDRESALDIVAETFVLLQAERACRERGE